MDKVTIHTDGSSKGNPGPGGWAAIIMRGKEVKEIGGRQERTTNNRMEMRAAIEALEPLPHEGEIEINTDSEYLLNGATKWIYGWQANGWKTKDKKDVLNKDLWEKLLGEISKREVVWKKVAGHSGHDLNERCDFLAQSFADDKEVKLYSGPKEKYQIPRSKNAAAKPDAGFKGKAGKAYSYVSMVNKVVQLHKTWGECEARVKNVKGARFRKALSPEEEKEIIGLFQGNI